MAVVKQSQFVSPRDGFRTSTQFRVPMISRYWSASFFNSSESKAAQAFFDLKAVCTLEWSSLKERGWVLSAIVVSFKVSTVEKKIFAITEKSGIVVGVKLGARLLRLNYAHIQTSIAN